MSDTYYGTVDGVQAKFVYHPARQQTQVYWGGMGKPDGIGHNHATIQDANPDTFHYLRVNGKLVVDQSFNPDDSNHRRRQISFSGVLRKSVRDALRYWRQ